MRNLNDKNISCSSFVRPLILFHNKSTMKDEEEIEDKTTGDSYSKKAIDHFHSSLCNLENHFRSRFCWDIFILLSDFTMNHVRHCLSLVQDEIRDPTFHDEFLISYTIINLSNNGKLKRWFIETERVLISARRKGAMISKRKIEIRTAHTTQVIDEWQSTIPQL